MGFIRRQEEKLAIRLLSWQYVRQNIPLPTPAELRRQASHIVDEGHRIGRESGANFVGIMKDLVKDIRKG